ncbi:MAG: hypothetical protein AAF490_06295, partial [Chloroflexota bacterium]
KVLHEMDMIVWQTQIEGEPQSFQFKKDAYSAVHKNLLAQAKELLDSLEMVNDGELTIVPIRNRAYLRN